MHRLIDLDRYPLDRPDSAQWRALADRCRADLERDGMFNLEGFLRPGIAEAAARALHADFATRSFFHRRSHNIYFTDRIDGLADDHPAQTRIETANHTLCGDQLPERPLPALYHWQPLHRFLATVMEMPALYPMDDVIAGVNAIAYGDNEALNWHFDRSEFTTTLLLQAPLAGGVFEYRSALRSDTDPNYDGVAALLQGRDPEIRQLPLEPGTLNVFRGRNTAHRVSPVEGDKARIIAVLSYYPRPGVAFSKAERIGFYGRAG